MKPLKSARPVVWFWNEVGELLLSQLPKCRSLRAARQAIISRMATLWRSADAVLDPADPLPFLGLHYMQVFDILDIASPTASVDAVLPMVMITCSHARHAAAVMLPL